MKLKLIFVFCIITISVLLFSCDDGSSVTTNDVSVNDILTAAIEGYDSASLPDTHTYMNDIPEGMEGLMFNDEFGSDVPQLQSVESYAMIVPASYNVFEIAVLKSADSADISELKTLLSNRLKVKNNGNIINYTPQEQPYLDSAEIHTIGKYVFLLATTDNKIAFDIISGMLKSDSTESSEVVENNNPPEEKADIGGVIKAQSIMNVDLDSLKIPEMTRTAETTLEKTALPTLAVIKHTANTQIFVGGKCSENAVIHIKGGLNDMVYRPDDDNFMGVTSISSSGVTMLSVTAQEDGKAESDPIMITVRPRNNVNIFDSHGIYGVIVGNDYQGHFLDALDDYIGANLFTDNQKTMVEKNIKDKVDFLKSDGLNAELIYLLIPNPMNLYPETVPEEYVHYTENSRTKQFTEIAQNAGATVIDLTDTFMEHRYDEYKLFHKTDSHWSYYGAYVAYKDLFDYIGEKFPAAKPRDRDLFEFYNKEVNVGDMAVHQEIEEALLKENTTFANFLWDINPNPNIYISDNSNLLTHDLISNTHTITNDDKNLPKAVLLRDSFGSSIYSMISDRFSTAYWQAMWNYSFDKRAIKDTDPDYYIYVVTERNIKNIMQ